MELEPFTICVEYKPNGLYVLRSRRSDRLTAASGKIYAMFTEDVSRRGRENRLSRGSCLSGLPLRQLISLRRVPQRLKVSSETALWLRTFAHSVPVYFHVPGGGVTTKVNIPRKFSQWRSQSWRWRRKWCIIVPVIIANCAEIGEHICIKTRFTR